MQLLSGEFTLMKWCPTGWPLLIRASCHLWGIGFLCVLVPLPCADAANVVDKRPSLSFPELNKFLEEGASLQNRLKMIKGSIFAAEERKHFDFHAKADEYNECWPFAYVDFYSNFSDIIDNIDTSPFEYPSDYRRDRTDDSIVFDARKIAVEVKYVMLAFTYEKAYLPPLHDFVIERSRDVRLQVLCHFYLSNH